jgi:basic membrane protein A and related proteins
MSRLTRRGFIAGTAAATGLSALPVLAADPFKVGFVYVGPVGDHGWSFAHDQARKAVEAKYGDRVKTSFVENVPEGPDAERVIRQLATSGNQLIFTTSFGFMNPTLRVAKAFPKLHFEHCTGYQKAENMALYNSRFYEGRAVIGTIAGHLTKSGLIGYVASFPIPEVVMGINAIALAAQKVRPDAKVKVIWVNSWYDPGKEADAAKALADQGCDIITQHTDSSAPLQVAEQRGLFAFGQASDMARFAPHAQMTAITDEWAPYYIERVGQAMAGKWKTGDVWLGLKDGAVGIAPYNDSLPPAVKAAAEKTRQDIIAGTLHPFDGPVLNQKGEVKIAAGKQPADGDLLKMDWYVQGVQA